MTAGWICSFAVLATWQIEEQVLRERGTWRALVLHPERLPAGSQLAVSQQWRRNIQGRFPGIRNRQILGQVLGCGGDRHQQRWMDGFVCSQRYGGEFSVPE